MNVRLTILCENSVGHPAGTIGEHGFACFIETARGNYLFDTGPGVGILRNSQVLKKDLASLRGVVLSHGHHDHAGGLRDVLGLSGPVEVFAHPGVFQERYWVGEHEKRFIGIPFRRPLLETLGARFRLGREFTEIAPGLHLSGEVPRVTPFETGDPRLMVPAENGQDLVPDPFADDLSLVIRAGKGLVLLVGCAHAGLVNIMRHVLEKTGCDRIHAVVGGTHLGPAGEAQFEGTLKALREYNVERVGVSHCTGLARAAQLQGQLSGRFFFASVGSVLEA